MSSPETIIRLELGAATEGFRRFLSDETAHGRIPADVHMEFHPSKRVAKGLGLTLPPEVVLAIATGAATEIGKQVGSLLWAALKRFFQTFPPTSPTASVVVIINDVRRSVPIHDVLGDRVPALFRDLDR